MMVGNREQFEAWRKKLAEFGKSHPEEVKQMEEEKERIRQECIERINKVTSDFMKKHGIEEPPL